MASVILVLTVVLLLLYKSYKYVFWRPDNFPPGPPRIPYLGSYLFLLLINYNYMHLAAEVLCRYYKSKVIGVFLGSFLMIVVNTQDGIKELLNRKEFDGRPDIFVARLRDPEYRRKGIFFNDGPVWKDQRRFILRYLRDFGFGRRFPELEIFMKEEISEMIDMLKNGPKYPHEKEVASDNWALCPHFMMPFTKNCFMYVVCGEKTTRKDNAASLKVGESVLKFQRTGDDYGLMLSLIPWIRYIFPNLSRFKPLTESSAVIYNYIKSVVDEHIETYDEAHVRNFIDLYIRKMKAAELNGEATTFLYDQFILGIVDFLFPPMTAIPAQISLLLQWFLHKPVVLRKIQAEIDKVVGQGRLPTLDDRKNMSYTEATIREIMRLETLVPSSIPHSALEDTEFMGYTVPKDTVMISGLYSFHMDKDVWNDPENFRPERFLDERGYLCLKKDISLPFGAGRRLCAGETFARNLLFLMVAAICQNFHIRLPPGQKLPDMKKPMSGIIITPKDFWIALDPR